MHLKPHKYHWGCTLTDFFLGQRKCHSPQILINLSALLLASHSPLGENFTLDTAWGLFCARKSIIVIQPLCDRPRWISGHSWVWGWRWILVQELPHCPHSPFWVSFKHLSLRTDSQTSLFTSRETYLASLIWPPVQTHSVQTIFSLQHQESKWFPSENIFLSRLIHILCSAIYKQRFLESVSVSFCVVSCDQHVCAY